MDPISRLTEYFREFPGIGPRQAKRFVYYLLTRNTSTLEELSRLILEIRKQVRVCSLCYRFYNAPNSSVQSNGAAGVLCPICADPSRDKATLMVVSKDADFEAIEKSGVYRGLYFILGGTVPILEKNPETRVRSRELTARISKNPPSEIILSLSATPDGEHTADYVRSLVKSFSAAAASAVDANADPLDAFITNAATSTNSTPKITVLGRGLSTGSELEYVDSDTIKSAFTNRG